MTLTASAARAGPAASGQPHRAKGAYTSAAHGWSTGVVPELTNDLLGAAPAEPGFRQVQARVASRVPLQTDDGVQE